MSVIWHGEGQPIASNGDPFGRQLNRRLDVRMISADEVQVSLGEIYLARPNVSFEKIAESFNLTVDQLKEQSGATSTKLRAYQPIRVVNSSSSPDFSLVAPTKLKNLSSFVYKVLPGEDIEDISTKFNVPEELIMELNGVTPDGISAGMEIKIYPVTSK